MTSECRGPEVYLPGSWRCLEAAGVSRTVAAGLPVPDLNAVLGGVRNEPGRNDVSARIRAVSLGDPDLQVDFLLSERQVIAFGAADDAATEVLDVDHPAHEFIVGVGEQQVRRRKRPVVLVFQLVPQMIDRARNIDLRVDILVRAHLSRQLVSVAEVQVRVSMPILLPPGADQLSTAERLVRCTHRSQALSLAVVSDTGPGSFLRGQLGRPLRKSV